MKCPHCALESNLISNMRLHLIGKHGLGFADRSDLEREGPPLLHPATEADWAWLKAKRAQSQVFHAKASLVSCPICTYRTRRSNEMKGHLIRKHDRCVAKVRDLKEGQSALRPATDAERMWACEIHQSKAEAAKRKYILKTQRPIK